jgi:hypothetical protein
VAVARASVDSGDQPYVENVEVFVLAVNDYGPPRRVHGDKLAMGHTDLPSIGQMESEWLKRLALDSFG